MASRVRAGGAFVEMGLDRGPFTRGLKAAAGQLKAFGGKVRNIGAAVTGAGFALAAPLAIATRQFSSFGDAIAKASRRTGIATETLSALSFAAEQSGADIEAVEKGVRTMQRSIFDLGLGLSTSVDAFDALGLSLKDVKGLSPEEQFAKISDAIAAIEDPSKKAAVAMKVFGRAGTALIPLMDSGGDAILRLVEDARELGIVLDKDTAAAAERLTDAMNRVKTVIKGTALAVGASLAPSLSEISDAITGIGKVVRKWTAANGELIKRVATISAVVIGAGGAILSLGLAIQVAGFALGGFVAIGTAATALIGGMTALVAGLATPFGLVAASVAAAATVMEMKTGMMRKSISRLGESFSDAKETATTAIGGIVSALQAGDMQLAARIAGLGIQLAFKEAVLPISEIWTDITFGILESWEKLRTNLSNAIDIGITEIANIWQTGVDKMKDAMLGFESVVRPTLERFFRRLQFDINNLFADSAEIAEAYKEIDRQIAADAANRDRDAGKDIAGREAAREAEIQQRRKELEARVNERRAARDEAISGIREASGKAVEAIDKEIAALREQLKSLVQSAAKEARDKAAETGEGSGGKDVAESLRRFAATSASSFDLGALSRRGVSPFQGLEAKTDEGNAILATINDNIKRLKGPRFAT